MALDNMPFPRGKILNSLNFTGGQIYLERVVTAERGLNTVSYITMEPGCRSRWHYHPDGQSLLCVAGEGYYQEKGRPLRVLHAGDVVKCLPGVRNWYGAASGQEFVQLSLRQDMSAACVWLNYVSEEEYQETVQKEETGECEPIAPGMTHYPLGEELNSPNFNGGKVYAYRLVTAEQGMNTVTSTTFEPGCRNKWHMHPDGQVLVCTDGLGCYQEKGGKLRLLHPGDTVEIQPNVIHWHGAVPDCWFTHLSIKQNMKAGPTVWMEFVTDEQYLAAVNAAGR